MSIIRAAYVLTTLRKYFKVRLCTRLQECHGSSIQQALLSQFEIIFWEYAQMLVKFIIYNPSPIQH